MPNFSDFYSRDDLAAYVEQRQAWKAGHEDEAKTRRWLQALGVLEAALLALLSAKAAAGELQPVAFSRDRALPWVEQWNARVRGGTCQDTPAWRQFFVGGMGLDLMLQLDLWNYQHPDASLGQRYAQLVALANDGANVQSRERFATCARTGQVIHVFMRSGWRPELGTMDRDRGFVPLHEEAPALAVQHWEIPVPSGELLVADWFRIPDFTQAVGDQALPSLASVAGRWAHSDHFAREHGFMHVIVNDRNPDVFVRDGQIVFANMNEDDWEIAGVKAGCVCTDRHSITLIDREVLVAILARVAGDGEARRRVAAFLEGEGMDTVRLNWSPGATLHFYCIDDEGLQGRFRCPDVDDMGKAPLYAVASEKPLQWAALA